MDFSLIMRFRVIAAMAIGAVILGLFGFGFARPVDPISPVTLFTGQITIADAAIFAAFAFATGFAAYFAAYPYGRPIAPLAVPTGLAVWALRTGTVQSLLITNNTVDEKMAVYSTFLWEGCFWFVLVIIGYIGVLAAEKIKAGKLSKKVAETANDTQKNAGLRYAMAIIASAVVAMFCIHVLAQDVKRFDGSLGSVIGQPSTGQIAFAVLAAFFAAAFLCKVLLNAPPIISAAAAVLIMVVAVKGHATLENITYMTEHWPVAYFSSSLSAILPIQIVAFGAIGSIAGFWMGTRYQYWQKNERENE